MKSLLADVDFSKELNDSGYVHDEGLNKSLLENGKRVHLLDFSDDVLLTILSHCGPSDLKALGFTCTRLASLIRDRTLWQRVDTRNTPYGRRRLRWLLEHALHAGTTKLMLKGFAAECAGCQGHVNKPRNEVEANSGDPPDKPSPPDPGTSGASTSRSDQIRVEITPGIPGGGRAHTHTFTRECFPLSRPSNLPSWPDDPPRAGATPAPPSPCPGPQFTLTPCLLRRLTVQCNLTELALEYCNINCNTISLSQFPPGLKALSLRGAKCFNMSVDKSFLFKIQDHLPVLEQLDLSECLWLEPSCMMCLSKMRCLRRLVMTNCPRMTEFVAYASLACRYGFKKLQIFDLRGSPIGDSEASAMGWLPELEELYLSAFRAPGLAVPPRDLTHHHYVDDVLVKAQELSDWELQEPEYFKVISQQRHKRGKRRPDEKCLHGVPFNKCTDGFSDEETKQRNDMKRKAMSDESPGPSKRKKSERYESSDEDDDDDDEEMNDGSDGDETNPKNCGNAAKNCENVSKNGENVTKNGENVPKNGENVIKNGDNVTKNEENAAKNEESNGEVSSGRNCEIHNEDENARANNAERNNGEMNNVENIDDEPFNDMDLDEEDENGERIINIQVNIGNLIPRDIRNIVNFGYEYDEQRNVINMNIGNIPRDRLNVDNIPRGPIYVENNRHDHMYVENVNDDQANDENVRDDRVLNNPEPNVENINNAEVNVENLNNAPENVRRGNDGNEEGDEIRNIRVEQVGLEVPGGPIYYPRNRRIYVKQRNNDGSDSESEQEYDECSGNEADAGENINNENENNRQANNENLDNVQGNNENSNNRANNVNLDNAQANDENLDNAQANEGNLDNAQANDENLDNAQANDENLDNRQANVANLNNEQANNNLDNEQGNRNEQNQEANGGVVYENRFEVNVQNVEVRPRSHVIFVNVGHQLNPIYRLAIPNEPGANNEFRRNIGLEDRRMAAHIPSSLITDSSMRSFGRSDEVRYQIGGPPDPKNCRPDKSNLKILSVQGYKNITDRSLNHLVIAAPKLEKIDFSQTNVTPDGVERFKVMRPDVEVVYSKFEPEPLDCE